MDIDKVHREIMAQGKENARHIAVMNDEMGDLRDHQEEMRVDVSVVKTDVAWLKKSYWVIVTTSLGALVAGIISIVVSK